MHGIISCPGFHKMKVLRYIYQIYWLPLLMLLHSCNAQTKKDDFIGKYQIDNPVPADTTSKTLLKIRQASSWTISLEEKNNFELTGTNKIVVGYWNIEKSNANEYRLLLQSGSWTIYGRFDGTTIYFNYPSGMFDSLFSQVTFTKARE
jgi:hypothetical protein